MASTSEIQFLLKAVDQASTQINAVKNSLTQMGTEAKNANAALGDAQKKAGAETGKLTGYIKEQRQEQRTQNFIFREGAQAVMAFAGQNKELSNVMVNAYGKFQLADSALGGLSYSLKGASGFAGALGTTLGAIALPIALGAAAWGLVSAEMDRAGNLMKDIDKTYSDLLIKLSAGTSVDTAKMKIEAMTAALDAQSKEIKEKANPTLWEMWKWLKAIEDGEYKDKIAVEQDVNMRKTKTDAIRGLIEIQKELIRVEEIAKTYMSAANIAATNAEIQKLSGNDAKRVEYLKKQADELKKQYDLMNASKDRAMFEEKLVKTELERLRVLKEISDVEKTIAENAAMQKRMREAPTALKARGFNKEEFARELAGTNKKSRMQGVDVEEVKEANVQLQQGKSFVEDLAIALNTVQDAGSMTFNIMKSGMDSFASGIGQAIATGQNMGEVFKQVGQQIVAQIIEMIVQLTIMKGLMTLLGGAFGIPIFHQGGVVQKAHGGMYMGPMAADERMILAQTGERVLSRTQNQAYERMMMGKVGGQAQVINVNISTLDTKSLSEYLNKPDIRKQVTRSVVKGVTTGKY